MKKLILSIALVIGATAAFGQGELVFNNNTATKITNGVPGTPGIQAWAAGPNSLVAIYGLAGNGQPASSLVFQPSGVTNLFAAGLFAGGQRSIAIPAGPATIQIRAWSGSAYANYEAATAGRLGGDNTVVQGQSNPFNMNLVASGTPGNPTSAGLNQFNVTGVPEPSSIALGLLGLGAIALFRRRK